MRNRKLISFILTVMLVVTMMPLQNLIPWVDSGDVQASTVSDLRAQFVDQAKTWLGTKESDGSYMKIINYFNANKPSSVPAMNGSLSWCAAYCSVVAMQCGFTDIMTVSRGAGDFGRVGTYHKKDSGYAPQPGDFILYCEYKEDKDHNMVKVDGKPVYLPDGTKRSHVGIVVSYDSKTKKVTTIDGNMNNSVMISTFSINEIKVHGFAEPNYAKKVSDVPGKLWTARSDFYAYLYNQAAWTPVEATSDGNVQITSTGIDNYSTKQIWRFKLQSDNSYIIENQYDGRVMEVANGGTTIGTNVQLGTADGSKKQKWYLYINSTGQFYIKSALSNYGLESSSTSSLGTNIKLGAPSSSASNIWNTKIMGVHTTLEYVRPAAPAAPVATISSTTVTQGQPFTLSWNAIAPVNAFDKRGYDIHIYDASGTRAYITGGLTTTSKTITLGANCAPGSYVAYVVAGNSNLSKCWTFGNAVKFKLEAGVFDISDATVTGIEHKFYTGSEIIQDKMTVVLDGVTLVEGTDYEVTYADNVEKGIATLWINGINSYTGTIEKGFIIVTVAEPTVTPEPEVTDVPTVTPTIAPTTTPDAEPTDEPAAKPTEEPTITPEVEPTKEPVATPTEKPIKEPTKEPTKVPTAAPTKEPTKVPTAAPTKEPTKVPTAAPTKEPTAKPTKEPTVAPTKAPSVEDFAERLYTTCLGRPAEEAGKDYWTSELKGGKPGSEVAEGFFFSQEYIGKKLTDKQFIGTLYETFMGRKPADAEVDYWVSEMDNGKVRKEVFDGFVNSPEWADICLEYGIRSGGIATPTFEKKASKDVLAFAERLYTTCLGRKAEQAGLEWWAAELANLRQTGTVAAQGFFFSPEFLGLKTSDKEYVTRLYRTFMGREPEKAGFDFWVGELKSGKSREYVFDGFSVAPEFADLCADAGIMR